MENIATCPVPGRHLMRTVTAAPNVRRGAAKPAVKHASELESMKDRITVSPRTSVETATQRIKSAMRRNPHLDDTHVAVTIIEDTAVLTGFVSSPDQVAQAAMASGASPEVTRIENRLRVRTW
ncbi:BON domain-containing protein [Nesterenkonia sp. CF4.4]|uniref:BON domain-containing protein n=1 Tax=Nesterenkonia sp. CF4.4 TaxID=3373079 RepID=UPI003EE6AE6D